MSTSLRDSSSSLIHNIDNLKDYSIRDSFNLIVLGDLHLEDDMSLHHQARDDCLSALQQLSLIPSPPSSHAATNGSKVSEDENDENQNDNSDEIRVDEILGQIEHCPAGDLSVNQLEMLLQFKKQGKNMNCHMVSLGDLGRKDIRHEPGDAGTTKSFHDAKEFLDTFQLPYDLVTGNHDLEGLDEFDTDEGNLQAWMDCFDKSVPYFSKQIGDRTLLVGLSTVRFRDSPYSSHECHADEEQLVWFENLIRDHSHEDGWRICVFTHAPIMGSKLRVLQNVHVVNGCAWMNHCSPSQIRSSFIRTVERSPQIKLWCSGHFHLSQDFPDSLSRVNQCTFVQVGVVGMKSTRDHTRQTRIVQGNSEILKIFTVNHHIRDEKGNANIRLDATLDLIGGTMELSNNSDGRIGASVNDDETQCGNEQWFGAFIPREEDGCYVENPSGTVANKDNLDQMVCWWHMHDGRVLGVHDGQVVEYDAETLSPLGIVVSTKELKNREVLVVDNSKAIVLVDPDTDSMEVVHPNDDGSYWRKYQRNKRIRQEEKARELAAKMWMERKMP